MVRTSGFHCRGPVSSPGSGPEIPQATWCNQEISKRMGSFTSCGRKQPPCCEEAQAASRAAHARENGGPGPTAPSNGHRGSDPDRQHAGRDGWALACRSTLQDCKHTHTLLCSQPRALGQRTRKAQTAGHHWTQETGEGEAGRKDAKPLSPEDRTARATRGPQSPQPPKTGKCFQ